MARMSDRAQLNLVVTCEHASAKLPAAYGTLGLTTRIVRSHLGWDPGAVEVARECRSRLRCEYLEGRYSRLLVDLNRSESHPRLIPKVAFGVEVPGNARVSARERAHRIECFWRPHREAVVRATARAASAGGCFHVAIHSFVPELDGRRRCCDVGLLYDPHRALEVGLATALQTSLEDRGLSVRRNYPYRGTSDGLTTALRRRFAARSYAGIEIEVNQALTASEHRRRAFGIHLCYALRSAVVRHRGGGDVGEPARRRQKNAKR